MSGKKKTSKQADAPLNKPFRTPDGPKKFAVYVNDGGKRKKVTFGDPKMSIKRDNPEARKNFRARHGCDKATDKTSAKYWSCKMWSKKPVSSITKESAITEPSWVADEGLWAKAKAQAAKSNPDDLYALTTDIYKKMGGEIKGKKQEQDYQAKPQSLGPKGTFLFFGQKAFSKSKKIAEAKPKVGEPEKKPLTNPEPSVEDQINKILADNPTMNAATLVNTLKAMGLAIVDQKDKVDAMKQADVSSGNLPVLRDGVKPKKKKEKKEKKQEAGIKDRFVSARFIETTLGTSKASQTKNKFKVALIQEGLGNLRDGFYYSANAIAGAITAFEGKKCYADHPARSEEIDRPERSVRDIIGHFENVHVEENADESKALCADLVIMPDTPYDWARALVRQSVEFSAKYPDKDFVGLSINASGDAEAVNVEDFLKEGNIPESCKPKIMKAIEQGLTQVRVVNNIRDAISTDLVTEAGAKGRVLEIIESKKEQSMAKKDILPKEQEEEMKQKHEAEQEDEAQDAPAGDDHADEEQDKKLILDMIKKHMGDDEMDEEESEAACAAHKAYGEMGYESEDAAKCAAHSMKLAKHMAAKQQEEEKKESEDESEKHESEDEAEKHESEDEAKKEAASMKLEARVAFLENELKKRDLTVFLDKKLAESKLPRSVTDKIRAKKMRSEKEVTEAIKIYVEAFKEAGLSLGGESKSKSSFFVTSTEKTVSTSAKGPKVSFADMLKNK